ncbi:hypothetical protein [Actinoplanes sp. NPDC049316]|uniref:hypothetical protein n=1 Tax=Actinoplanes sp. NPDC049316 TaxID=3154727 RepID=UPI00342BEDA7
MQEQIDQLFRGSGRGLPPAAGAAEEQGEERIGRSFGRQPQFGFVGFEQFENGLPGRGLSGITARRPDPARGCARIDTMGSRPRRADANAPGTP